MNTVTDFQSLRLASSRLVLRRETYDRYKKNNGFVYLIHAEGTSRFKIGRSQYPEIRVAQIQKQSPYKLILVSQWWSPDCFYTEAKLHERYAEHRIFGEWFNFSEELFAGDDLSFELILDIEYRLPEVYELSSEIAFAFLNALFENVANFCPCWMHGVQIATFLRIQDYIVESCKSFDDFKKLLLVFNEIQYRGRYLHVRSKQDTTFSFESQESAELYLDVFCEKAASALSSFRIGIKPWNDIRFECFE